MFAEHRRLQKGISSISEHLCMKDKIEYKDLIPTYGNHRPLWPKYGEYRYKLIF